MLKPLDSPTRQALIHHPTDALDTFGHYDDSNVAWTEFDRELNNQIAEFETQNKRYIRPRPAGNRRSSF